ncbi:MAG: hypothetical protein ACMUHB_01805 [Thermoplasmatota archaeon]
MRMDVKGPDDHTSGSKGLARMGAVSTWLSVGILILSLMVLFSYIISQTGEVVTEDDFVREAENLWTVEIEIGDMGSLSILVESDDPVEIELTLMDERGRIEKTYTEETPLEEQLVMMDEGRYTVEIVIVDEEKDIEDLEIELVPSGMDTFNACLGSVCIISLFLMIGATGLIFTIFAISKRNSELRPPEVLPPWLAWSRQPPPPPGYPPPYNQGVPAREGPREDWGTADYWNRRGSGKW